MASRACTILDIYYSCGLRRTEGEKLELSDVQLENRTLVVRFGKKGKQRRVPFTKEVADRFTIYIERYRHSFLRDKEYPQLLINSRGTPLGGQSCFNIVQRLKNDSGLTSLDQKNIGLHSLRHSVATHLLASGMDIYLIKKFLGHASLESTQIYTHLASKLKEDDLS